MSIRSRILLRILVSVVLATLICLVFIDREYRYSASVVSDFPYTKEREYRFPDLDSDGRSEKILVFRSGKETTSLIVHEWDDDLIDQINVSGRKVRRSARSAYQGDRSSSREMSRTPSPMEARGFSAR